MSGHEKKGRPARIPGKGVIAAPPRVALSGRSNKTDAHDDGASAKSAADGNGSETDEAEFGAKDKRIAELEATMTDYERELALMREEKRQEESETAAHWQQKYSSLYKTYLNTDTDLRLLRQEVSSFQKGREDRDRDYKTTISTLMQEREGFREAYNLAMGEKNVKDQAIKDLQSQIKELQSQVWGLKNFVSASSKMDEQVTDEFFAEQMQRLGNLIQNWVITNFRRAKLDTEKSSEDMRVRLLHLVPTYEALAATSKVHLIQSIVSRLFVNFIFEQYFVGLPKEQADELKSVERYLGSFGSTESMNQWRSTTLALLRKEAVQKLQNETAAVVDALVGQVNTILSSISDAQGSDSRDQSLRALINSSIDLSRLLRVQKAVFTIIMPSIEDHQRMMFDVESMEDIGGEDEDTLHEREIRCVTFPGITKSGDENGESFHLRNIVAKIRVLCAPD